MEIQKKVLAIMGLLLSLFLFFSASILYEVMPRITYSPFPSDKLEHNGILLLWYSLFGPVGLLAPPIIAGILLFFFGLREIMRKKSSKSS
ncbi:MAG: hypothetical protein HQM09_25295 [Candidatus Riflebacteria bacterium]|nr:hypothetical protein [Candidatus Riflebacteria bacterium]